MSPSDPRILIVKCNGKPSLIDNATACTSASSGSSRVCRMPATAMQDILLYLQSTDRVHRVYIVFCNSSYGSMAVSGDTINVEIPSLQVLYIEVY